MKQILVFHNPCDKDLIRKKTIPTKGTSKRRIDYPDNSFEYKFTCDDWYFNLIYKNNTYTLLFSNNPDFIYLECEKMDCQVITKK